MVALVPCEWVCPFKQASDWAAVGSKLRRLRNACTAEDATPSSSWVDTRSVLTGTSAVKK